MQLPDHHHRIGGHSVGYDKQARNLMDWKSLIKTGGKKVLRIMKRIPGC